MVTITIRNSKETIILGTRAENLIVKILDWCANSRFSPLNETEILEAKNILAHLEKRSENG